MDNKVIVQLQLFDYQQNVVVIKDGNKVASFKAPITELAHTIKTTANKYQIYDVFFTGVKNYPEKIIEDIKAKDTENKFTFKTY